jgi:hypothetical protein
MLAVIGIMARWLPDLIWNVGGTHVHHLNYGIFLGIAAFAPPVRQWRPMHWGQAVTIAAVVLGFYLALSWALRWATREEPRLEHLEEAGPQWDACV